MKFGRKLWILSKILPSQTPNKLGQGETADDPVAGTGEKMSSLQCDEAEIETEGSQFMKQNQELLELFDRLHRQGYDEIVRK